MLKMSVLYLCFVFCMISQFIMDALEIRENLYPADVIEEGELNTEQLIRKYNYPAETHFVNTKDGYILQLHRIRNDSGKPILLQHGILDSSATYVLMGPGLSLGYYLYDHGYDVWMGNARGNRYSRNHTTLNPDRDESFWNFSWHEIGLLDIPAMIDYVLLESNSDKLYYVGHSQGTTVLFVICSLRPEYNSKIILAHALAPVAFVKHIWLVSLIPGKNFLTRPNILDKGEMLPKSDIYKNICLASRQMEDVCLNLFFMIMGRDMERLNRTRLPTILGHIPAGAAWKQLKHYYQLVISGKFRQFDYEEGNQEIYGQSNPPDYDLAKVIVPIVLHYSLNDLLSTVIDVINLSKQLPNAIELHEVKEPQWNHMDFVYAKDAPELIYEVIELTNNKYQKN